MKTYIARLAMVFVLALTPSILGCDDSTPAFGFGVVTLYERLPGVFEPYHPYLELEHVRDLYPIFPGEPPATGSEVGGFGFACNAPCYILDGRTPAEWRFTVAELPIYPCGTQSVLAKAHAYKDTTLACAIGVLRGRFSASPENPSVEAYNYMTVTGPGISNTYGMPKIFLYSSSGVLMAEAEATSCGSSPTPGDDPWMSGNVWIPRLGIGEYTFIVSNRTQGGGYEDIGGWSFLAVGPIQQGCDPTDEQVCITRGCMFDSSTCTCTCVW